MREFFDPSWRMYFVERGGMQIVMLGGGDKSTPSDDIAIAWNRTNLGIGGSWMCKSNTHSPSMVQLPPSFLQPLDADRLRGAQFLRKKAHAQLFQ